MKRSPTATKNLTALLENVGNSTWGPLVSLMREVRRAFLLVVSYNLKSIPTLRRRAWGACSQWMSHK